jgi:hypothetical protein
MEKIIERIIEGYGDVTGNSMGKPRVFCSGNPNRCFVTWTSGSMPESYARYYIRDFATPEEKSRLGIVDRPEINAYPINARHLIQEWQAARARAARIAEGGLYKKPLLAESLTDKMNRIEKSSSLQLEDFV